jgi:hypothetical protein
MTAGFIEWPTGFCVFGIMRVWKFTQKTSSLRVVIGYLPRPYSQKLAKRDKPFLALAGASSSFMSPQQLG